jgi:hypothetical protein
MRRSLGVVALVLAVRATPALADPLDLDLEKLGAPTAGVWQAVAGRQSVALSDADAARLAVESKQRYALLATQLGLALSSSVLAPASTTGQLGYAVDLEVAYAEVDGKPVGQGLPGLFAPQGPFPVRSAAPSAIVMPALHVRKSLPMSFELGGRAIYLNQTQLMAAQGEAKWALNEAYGYFPDFAVRGALTHLFGQRDLDLTTADLDLLLSRRFGVAGVMNLTPYGAVRFTWIGAATDAVDFGPIIPGTVPFPDARTPAQLTATQARFPELKMGDHLFTRYTLGLRLVTKAISLAVEGSYFAGKSFSGPASPGDAELPAFTVPSQLAIAAKAGLEF